MKIILLKDIKGLGRTNEIKEVKSGYARNFLIPQKLAEPATKESLSKLELIKSSYIEKENRLKSNLKELKEKLKKEDFIFYLKVGRKGEIYSSVSREEIENRIKEKGFFDAGSSVNFRVNIKKPIKSIGQHEVEVDLERGIKEKITISVQPLP
ncbi:MAG: 50S ribosomal protein L9 [Candidatus Liptonbacteria bacterium]|nr:50S ribosomal protein L9 [Candidatus Liptonbacteria bacterium]